MRTVVRLHTCFYSDDVITQGEARPRLSKLGEFANEKT